MPAEPAIEAVDVEGAERTRPAVVLDAVGLRARGVLTRDAFERAARKLNELPGASSTDLRQRAGSNGDVRVTAAIHERALVPRGFSDWAVVGGRAVFVGDLKIDVAGPFGAGEVFSGIFRWAPNRPSVGFGLAVPQLGALPGITRFAGFWERQTYAIAAADALAFRETRQRVGIDVGDWAASWLAWHAGTAFDRFTERNNIAMNAGVDIRLWNDLVGVIGRTEMWLPTDGGNRFTSTDLLGTWRSRREPTAPWNALLGTTITSDGAPLALWPGASAGRGRGILLRAHPLHDDGIVSSEVFGRRIVYASVERQHPVKTMKIATIGVAGFVDTAKVWRRAGDAGASPLHVDIGGGLRVNAPRAGGMIRVDVGYGLRDGEVQLSAGWIGAWPRR